MTDELLYQLMPGGRLHRVAPEADRDVLWTRCGRRINRNAPPAYSGAETQAFAKRRYGTCESCSR
jgi:hypothetical protein